MFLCDASVFLSSRRCTEWPSQESVYILEQSEVGFFVNQFQKGPWKFDEKPSAFNLCLSFTQIRKFWDVLHTFSTVLSILNFTFCQCTDKWDVFFLFLFPSICLPSKSPPYASNHINSYSFPFHLFFFIPNPSSAFLAYFWPSLLHPCTPPSSLSPCPTFHHSLMSYIHSSSHLSPFHSSTEPWEGNGASLCSPVRTLRCGVSAAAGADRPHNEEQPAGVTSGPGSAVWTTAGQRQWHIIILMVDILHKKA